ncbi:MAG TPA: formylglycine-generating enzyme family protein [Solirubrobacterales bacterium]|nr:formylglycine-generating enzyme family protein [Solirubrobacterales bacterium]
MHENAPTDGSCCGPSRGSSGEAAPEPPAPGAKRIPRPPEMVSLEGGSFLMGAEGPDSIAGDGEGPVREVELAAFSIDACAVSNDRFAAFVEATGHVTDAERYGWSFVFGGLLPDEFPETRGVIEAPWWRQVFGACWNRPEGPHSSLDDRQDHPVVHVSWRDANAFCDWSGTRLPTEVEWEHAARGGLVQRRFPWGDELEPGGEHRMNVWQGTFPSQNTLGDGFLGTCPVDAFPANGYGLHNTSGNVWEWCADAVGPEARATRGGSYLCHHSYCNRYRVAARSSNTADSSTGNTGFRCAR